METRVRGWAAWSPGLDSRAAWEGWARSPATLGIEGSPDVRFLPPLLRRRCSRLTRMMLHAAYEACAPDELATLPVVCASRYGEMTTTVELLRCLAAGEPLTAAGFTHSVHNTQAGLFSIATRNRRMASALAAGADTFSCALLEALTLIHRGRGGAVLVLVGDEPLPAVFASFEEDACAAYAVAIVLEPAARGPRLRLEYAAQSATARRRWPQAVEFLRWHLSGEKSLTLGAEARTWTWKREE
jgi:hypothetical protein